MEVGKQAARISDYGVTKTKAGTAQVFITFMVGQESGTWYGVPFKKDGEPNDMCLMQLATCGFDLSTQTIEGDLAKGPIGFALITDEDIDVTVKDVIQPDGSVRRKIDSIGEFGPSRATEEETKQLINEELSNKLKAVASKFKVRKKAAKENPSEDHPF